jgi:hypothetical protein
MDGNKYQKDEEKLPFHTFRKLSFHKAATKAISRYFQVEVVNQIDLNEPP